MLNLFKKILQNPTVKEKAKDLAAGSIPFAIGLGGCLITSALSYAVEKDLKKDPNYKPTGGSFHGYR